MRQTSGTRKSPGEKIVKDIKRATRKHYSSEEKIRIVLDGLRGEDSIAELCRLQRDISSRQTTRASAPVSTSKDYQGWMHADGYAGFEELYRSGGEHNFIDELCWFNDAHLIKFLCRLRDGLRSAMCDP